MVPDRHSGHRQRPGHRWRAAGGQPLGHHRGGRGDDGGRAARPSPRSTARCGCWAPTWSSTRPFLGPISRKAGNTLACNPDAERLLSSGEVVAVYPEGFKGVGKPYSQRYKLQRFGRGGFVTAALKTGVPIIPVSIVGAEEIYPLIGNIKPLARALGFPYFPVTPTFPLLGPLGAIPLPSKWLIEFGEPIPTDGYGDHAADDPMVVFNLTDRVRETIQQTLYRLLLRRGHPFLG